VIAAYASVSVMLVQTALNVLGSVDILPFTGVTVPFVSRGGSSLVSCWTLLAFIKAADTRQNASCIQRLPKKSAAEQIWAADREPTGEPAAPSGGFFADRPDIPVDEIFGKEDRQP
jgi:hypothetical protein